MAWEEEEEDGGSPGWFTLFTQQPRTATPRRGMTSPEAVALGEPGRRASAAESRSTWICSFELSQDGQFPYRKGIPLTRRRGPHTVCMQKQYICTSLHLHGAQKRSPRAG